MSKTPGPLGFNWRNGHRAVSVHLRSGCLGCPELAGACGLGGQRSDVPGRNVPPRLGPGAGRCTAPGTEDSLAVRTDGDRAGHPSTNFPRGARPTARSWKFPHLKPTVPGKFTGSYALTFDRRGGLAAPAATVLQPPGASAFPPRIGRPCGQLRFPCRRTSGSLRNRKVASSCCRPGSPHTMPRFTLRCSTRRRFVLAWCSVPSRAR